MKREKPSCKNNNKTIFIERKENKKKGKKERTTKQWWINRTEDDPDRIAKKVEAFKRLKPTMLMLMLPYSNSKQVSVCRKEQTFVWCISRGGGSICVCVCVCVGGSTMCLPLLTTFSTFGFFKNQTKTTSKVVLFGSHRKRERGGRRRCNKNQGTDFHICRRK